MLCRQIRAISLFLSIIFILLCFPHTVGVYAETTETKYYSVQDYSYEVSLTVISTWQDHANIDLTISNNGDTPIEDWYLTFNSSYQIENIWNASVVEAAPDGTCTIKNASYNQDILPNSQVTVGMTLSSVDPEIADLSSWYLLNMQEAKVDEDKYSFTYIEYSSWGAGFSGAFILSSNETIEDWSVEFESDHQITNVSNAVISVEGNSWTLKNDGNTRNIYPDNPITISIQGIPAENDIINNCVMKNVVLAYSLSEDINENGIPDYLDFINEQEGVISVTPTEVPTDTPTITEEPTPTTEPTVTEEPDYYLDSDEDRLTDYVEEFYGTDKNDPDSDDDNLSDYYEIIMGYDPNIGDSDDNGILDGYEDYDNDGISNSEEIRLGTEPQMEDSDLDELSDYDEIYVYGSDPGSEDSNNDGITDGDAVFLGFDPTSDDSDGNGIPDNQEQFLQDIVVEISEDDIDHDVIKEVKVEGNISNRIESVMTVKNVYGKKEYATDIPAQVGVPIDIECQSSFDKLTVTFYYDDNALGNTREEDLGIYWLDEEMGMLVDVDSVVDKELNTITFVTDHLSIWIPFDKEEDKLYWGETVNNYSMIYNTKENSSKEGTVYTLMVQFGNTVNETEKYNTMTSVADLMGYIGEQDRVVVYAYNSTNVREQYNYLILGEWDEEHGVQMTKFYRKDESAKLLLALHNILYGDYRENYYANLMTINEDEGKEINYENWWYQEKNHIESDKEDVAAEGATNAIWQLLWNYTGFEFRIKHYGLDLSYDEKKEYDKNITDEFRENDDFYFHISEHENVCIVFANGTQYLTTDINSPLEVDGNWREFRCFFSNYKTCNLQLYLVYTGNEENPEKLNLNTTLGGYESEDEYQYGLWPYTHGGMINLTKGEFGSLFKKYRDLNYGLDEDGDGLWDINEERGMVGANGKILKSDPAEKQSDYDGISDGEEMGKVYTIILTSKYNEDSGSSKMEMRVNGLVVDRVADKRFERFYKYGSGMWTIYTYKSDPMLEDTDGDYYFDQYDNKPLSNCIETYDLGGGEFTPLTKDFSSMSIDEGYIHIYDAPNDPKTGYGGNQGWFSEGEITKKLVITLLFKKINRKCTFDIDVPVYSDEESGKDYLFLHESGCGLIAMTDVMLYLENGNIQISYDDYKTIFLSNARRVFDYSYIDDWFDFIDVVYPNNDENDDIFMPVPVLPITMSPMLNSMGYRNERIVIDDYSEEFVLKQIKSSLKNDKPVILNEMDYIGMIENMDSGIKKGFPMYNNLLSLGKGISGKLDESNVMTDHYVTITGLIKDYQSDTVWLRVQTWGEVYYLRLDEFYKYNQPLPCGTLIIIE